MNDLKEPGTRRSRITQFQAKKTSAKSKGKIELAYSRTKRSLAAYLNFSEQSKGRKTVNEFRKVVRTFYDVWIFFFLSITKNH